jgi:hypothetical protein
LLLGHVVSTHKRRWEVRIEHQQGLNRSLWEHIRAIPAEDECPTQLQPDPPCPAEEEAQEVTLYLIVKEQGQGQSWLCLLCHIDII